MVAVPVVLPVMAPVSSVMLATAGSLLLQVPPGVAQVKGNVSPSHRATAPTIGAVDADETVIIVVAIQPVDKE
jgi:hypothetical protein